MSKIVSKLNEIFNESDKFNNTSRKTLEQYGNSIIKSVKLGKVPLHPAVSTAVNVLTLGQMNTLQKKYGYDKLYHVFMVVQCENSPPIVIEKNEVINIAPFNSSNSKMQFLDVNITMMQNRTLNDFILRTWRRMKGSFFIYDPFNNNCQVFLINLLQANGLWNHDYENFFFQNVSGIRNELPSFAPKVMRKITDIGALASRIIGRGAKNEKQCCSAFKKYMKNINETDPEKIKEHFIDFANTKGFKYL